MKPGGAVMTNKDAADTLELPALDFWTHASPHFGSARVQVDLGALSHQGLVRSNNEDHYVVVRLGRMLETLLTNVPAGQLPDRAEEVGYGLLVADGIGGASAGEVASRLAITTLINLVLRTPDWIFSTGAQAAETVKQRMAERYQQIDAALRDQSARDPGLSGMGTTMTLAYSLGNSLILGHIGDSRAYLVHGGELHQLTRDHTFVQALVAMGALTPEQAATHRCRHVLLRSLGGGEQAYQGDFERVTLSDGDQLLLCTDGLTDMVDNKSIASVLEGAVTATEACRQLVDLALNGGKDNATVALARYRFLE
jgi:serine/threonine protein phosphatase PrpC